MEPQYARSTSLRTSYWRREILQLLLWIQGEGFGDHIDAALLERAFGIECQDAVHHLDELTEAGLLSCDGDGLYRLTVAGQRYCSRLIADEFIAADLDEGRFDRRGEYATNPARRRPRTFRPRCRGDGGRPA